MSTFYQCDRCGEKIVKCGPKKNDNLIVVTHGKDGSIDTWDICDECLGGERKGPGFHNDFYDWFGGTEVEPVKKAVS